MVSYSAKSYIVFFGLLFNWNISASAQTAQPDAWQFHSFFGEYSVAESDGNCKLIGSTVFIRMNKNNQSPLLEIKSAFSSAYPISVELKTDSYAYCSSDHGEPCNGESPDIWGESTISGDGIKNAIFRQLRKDFGHSDLRLVIELVRVNTEEVLFKYNECTARLELK